VDILKVKKLSARAILPRRATEQSAGADLAACLEEPFLLPAGGLAGIPTGIAVEIAPGWAGFVFGRSGLGTKHGITLSNSVGVIDADYRGELHIGLCNHGSEGYLIQPGERIAQLVLLPVGMAEIVEVESLSDTGRGTGGFGSTGR